MLSITREQINWTTPRLIFRLVYLLAAILSSIIVTSCTNSLVYGERTSFSLIGLYLNNDPGTPLRVHTGFNRSLIALVPPTEGGDAAAGGVPENEAVSMFSGFRLKYVKRDDATGNLFFDRRLTIRTQFASGYAARDVSTKPDIVNKIVTIPFERDESFTESARQERVDGFLTLVGALPDDRAIELAKAPPVLDDASESTISNVDPKDARFTDGEVARRTLKMRVVLSNRDDAALDAWEAALTAEQ